MNCSGKPYHQRKTKGSGSRAAHSHEAAYVSPLEAKFSKQCKYSWAILWAVNRCSNTRLILRRSNRSSVLIASTASVSFSTINPVTPWSIISGIDPRRQAITGVPQAMASITTSPNGSGQSIGKRRAAAFPRKSAFAASSTSPTSTQLPSTNGRMCSLKYRLSERGIFAAIRSGRPTVRAIRMAASGPFSGAIRPRNAR